MKRWVVLLSIFALLAACRPTTGPAPLPAVIASPEPIRTPTCTATIVSTATLAPEPSSTSTAPPTTVPTPLPSHTPTPTPFVPRPPNDNNYAPRISADGRYIAFVSWADNLVEGDTNERPDVFVYDRYTGQITRASVASDGTQSDGVSVAPAISAYGRWIAFASEARSLAPNQTDWEWNVFVHEPRTGRTEQMTQYASSLPSLSADGRYLALVGTRHIYVHDRQTGQSERISTGIDGTPGNGQSTSPAISADGRYVAFWSWAGNLVAGDEQDCEQAGAPLSCGDVFVYDRHAHTMERIPVGEGYGLGGGEYELSISADGRWVVFRGTLYDRQTKTQSSFCSLGTNAQNAAQTSVMSADGRWIAFSDGQVYLCDRTSGKITQVSTAPDGTPGDGPSGILYGHEGYSGSLDLSADGRWLVFTSQAGNLMPGQVKDPQCQRPLAIVPGVPHCYDVYLYDRETGAMVRLGTP